MNLHPPGAIWRSPCWAILAILEGLALIAMAVLR